MVGIRLRNRRMMYFDIIPSAVKMNLPGKREGIDARRTAAAKRSHVQGKKKTEGAGAPSVQGGSISPLGTYG